MVALAVWVGFLFGGAMWDLVIHPKPVPPPAVVVYRIGIDYAGKTQSVCLETAEVQP